MKLTASTDAYDVIEAALQHDHNKFFIELVRVTEQHWEFADRYQLSKNQFYKDLHIAVRHMGDINLDTYLKLRHNVPVRHACISLGSVVECFNIAAKMFGLLSSERAIIIERTKFPDK